MFASSPARPTADVMSRRIATFRARKSDTDQSKHEQGYEERLRAAHNVILGAEPDSIDVDAEICILRS